MFDIETFINQLTSIATILFFALIAYWIVLIFSRKWRRIAKNALGDERLDDPRVATLDTVVRIVGGIVILFVAGSMILRELRIDISPLLTGAGILGLIITFSVQTLLRDIVAGVFILFESQYGPGMRVTLNDVSGIVERLSLRTTVLRDSDGNRLYIPNGEIKLVRVHEKKR